MKNSTLNNFSFKKALLVCLFVAISVALSGLFVVNRQNNVPQVSAQEIEQSIFAADGELKQYEVECPGMISESKHDGEVSTNSINVSGNHCTYSSSGDLPSKVYGGSSFKFEVETNTGVDKSFYGKITITPKKADGTNGTVVTIIVLPGDGYKVTGFMVNNSIVALNEGLSSEDLDGSYKGTIAIVAQTQAITYTIQACYEDGGVFKTHSINYTYESEFNINDYRPTVSGQTFDYWVAVNKSLTGSTIVWDNTKIGAETSPISTARGAAYKLTSINKKSFGDITQNYENPTIIAVFKKQYSVKVDNSYDGLYWKNSSLGLTEANQKNLYYAGSNGFIHEIQIADILNGNSVLMGTENAFVAQSQAVPCAAGTSYKVFNYGHSISGWRIAIEYKTSSDEGWKTLNKRETTGTTLQSIAQYLNTHMATCIINKITFKPIWQPVNITVKDESDNTINAEAFKFGEEYTLAEQTLTGQTNIAFKQGNNLIAKTAVWNYKEDLTYSGSGNDYTITVAPYGLNNVYKVFLSNIDIDTLGTYEMASGSGYAFNSNSGVASWNSVDLGDVNTYTAFETLTGYSSATYPLVESYISSYLEGFITDYEGKTDGDGNSDYDIFKRVYYFSGTKESDDKITGNTTGFIWLYIAHNMTIEELPMFISEYKGAVAWKMNNESYLKSTEWHDDYSVEYGTCESNWVWSQASPYLTACNMNKVYLYYNTDVEEFGRVEAKYYGKDYTLQFGDLGEGITWDAEYKFFGGWVLDSQAAKENEYNVSFTLIGMRPVIFVGNSDRTETWTFDVERTVENLNATGECFYFISSIKRSTATTSGSPDFIQDGSNPIIKAYWSNQFDVNIVNNNTYWATIDGGSQADNSDLYGAVSNNPGEDFYSTTIILQNMEGFEYTFMNSVYDEDQGLSFLHGDEYADGTYAISVDSGGYYYVYNYGHYISGWFVTVQFIKSDGSTESKILTSSLNFVDTGTAISITNALTMNFLQIAQAVDDYMMANGYVTTPIITMKPTWEKARLQVKNGSSEISSEITFGSLYNLTTSSLTSSGKTLYAVKAGDSYISAISNGDGYAGHWNYTKIQSTYFTNYNTSGGGMVGSGTYTLEVGSVFLDNIYKIQLNNVVTESSNAYKIENGFNFTQNESKHATMLNFFNGDIFDNSYNFVYYTTDTETLIDDYISTLKDRETKYIEGIDGDNSGKFTIFDKLFTTQGTISSATSLTNASGTSLYIYLATNQTIADLPRFKNDLSSLVYWEDSLYSNAYTTTNYHNGYDEEVAGRGLTVCKTTSSKKWTYSSDPYQKVIAGYMYSVRVYYKYYDQAEYSSINTGYKPNLHKNGFFGDYVGVHDLKTANVPAATDKQIFSDWIFDKAVLEANYSGTYTFVSDDTTNKEIKISSASGSTWKFKYSAVNEYFSTKYYITGVNGDGRFVQNEEHPIIYAKWRNIYSAEINNTTNLWNSLDSENSTLYGAYSKDDTDTDFKTTTIKLVNTEDYNFKFLTSEYVKSATQVEGLSYYHLNDWKSADPDKYYSTATIGNYYYVFNYGHYISGWKITFNYDGQPYYLDTSFTAISGYIPAEISIDDLISRYLHEIAKEVDERFAGYDKQASIILSPCWEETNITLKIKASSDANADFRTKDIKFEENTYSLTTILNNNIYSQDGKSIMSLYYGADYINNLISKSGRWNYREIPKSAFDSYTVDEDGLIGQGKYTLILMPHYVNDIYKVTLENPTTYKVESTTNIYKLSNTDYQFFDEAGHYDNASEYQLTYADDIDKNGSYKYKNFDSDKFNLVDNYIEDLRNYVQQYENGISSGSLEILRKVYYTTDKSYTLEVENGVNTLLNVSNRGVPVFHMYLANAEDVGKLPIFTKEYYDLIFWENKYTDSEGRKYAYKTSMYNHEAEGHPEEIATFHTHEDNTWHISDDTKNGIGVTFVANYFRKNYEIQISTIFEGSGDVERRGYAVLQIEDIIFTPSEPENVDKTYLIIFDNSNYPDDRKMRVFDYAGILKDNWDDTINNYNNTEYSKLVLYAGCDITLYVFDQSKDPTSMASGKYDDMIGYKFIQNIRQKLDGTLLNSNSKVFTQINSTENYFEHDSLAESVNMTNYSYSASAEHIEGLGFTNKQHIQIEIEFAKILYSMDIKIDEATAGQFDILINGGTLGYKTSYTLSGIKVYDQYDIYYYAYAGYKMQNNAFILKVNPNKNTNLHTLQTYNEDTATKDAYYLKQNYFVTQNYYGNNEFDGSWLREYFYSYNTDYAVDLTDIGELMLQTEVIEFNFGLKIYDATQVGTEIFETKLTETLKLDKSTGEVSTTKISNYLDPNRYDFYIYVSEDNTEYALLNSRLYFPHNHLTKQDNRFTTYSFLLDNEPTNRFLVNSYVLQYMVVKSEANKGIIINPEDNNRDIYLMLEVRELLEIEVKVAKISHDTNSTTRKTTISNADNNLETLTLSPNEASDEVSPFDTSIIEGTYIKQMLVYTYKGLTNHVISEFDPAHYERVEYVLNNSANSLGSNEFEVEEDSTLVVKFMPFAINETEFIYTLEGEQISLETALEYINETVKPNTNTQYFINNTLTYVVECIANDYNVSVSINDVDKGRTTADAANRTLTVEHTISSYDFNCGKLVVKVNIVEQDNSVIRIKYQLADSSKKCADDNYGTMTVIENSTIKAQDVEQAQVEIVAGRDVYVQINIPRGYTYRSVKHNTYNAEALSIDAENKIKIISEYDPETDTGEYVILLDKVDVTVQLNTQGTNENSTYLVNGKNLVTGLYVGSVISFTAETSVKERLDYFYYQGPGGQYKLLDAGTNKPIMTTKITSEMLTNANTTNIVFKVAVVERFRLSIQLNEVSVIHGKTTEDYIGEDGIVLVNKSTNTEYVATGKESYVDKNTQISLSVETILSGKYNITLQMIQPNPDTLKTNTNLVENVNEIQNLIITLDQDYVYLLTIAPNVYSIEVEENLYTNLSAVLSGEPDVLDIASGEQVNAISSTQHYFSQNVELSFVRKAADRELNTIFISNNDLGVEIVVEFSNSTFMAYKIVDGDKEQIDLSYYGIEFNTNASASRVVMKYTTYNNLSIRFDYKEIKLINS